MAAKKNSVSSKKKATPKKAASKKKAAAKKKAAPKKASATPKAVPKKAAASKKAVSAKKSAAAKPPAQAKGPEGSVSSLDVSLGHVFSFKPRLNTSFKRDDFQQAKRALENEVYEDLRSAVRAVAEEALSLTRGAASKPRFSKRR